MTVCRKAVYGALLASLRNCGMNSGVVPWDSSGWRADCKRVTPVIFMGNSHGDCGTSKEEGAWVAPEGSVSTTGCAGGTFVPNLESLSKSRDCCD